MVWEWQGHEPQRNVITLYRRHMKETESVSNTWWFEEIQTTSNIQNIKKLLETFRYKLLMLFNI
jgi:hypothetical protein